MAKNGAKKEEKQKNKPFDSFFSERAANTSKHKGTWKKADSSANTGNELQKL